MKSNIFIPEKINIGFQNRESTYTGKLAYIIYFDEKGKLRKETSWNSWRDKNIENQIHNNEPTSGFVLNKDAGGYSSGWNYRQSYIRVYDPRGFEFEITLPNLLYILENATSTKGKGLEGEFVYGWDGKDLVLISTEAPDYKELVKLNEVRHSDKKIGAKQLKIGATYRTRQNEEWVYMGKFDEYGWNGEKSKKPKFWFFKRYETEQWGESGRFETIASVSQKLIEAISEDCAEDYADLFDNMECKTSFSPINESANEYIPFTKEEIEKAFEKTTYRWYRSGKVYNSTRNSIDLQRNDEGFYYDYINPNYVSRYSWNGIRNIENDSNVNTTDYRLRVKFKNTDELIEKLKPMRKRQYLENGKIYSEGY